MSVFGVQIPNLRRCLDVSGLFLKSLHFTNTMKKPNKDHLNKTNQAIQKLLRANTCWQDQVYTFFWFIYANQEHHHPWWFFIIPFDTKKMLPNFLKVMSLAMAPLLQCWHRKMSMIAFIQAGLEVFVQTKMTWKEFRFGCTRSLL